MLALAMAIAASGVEAQRDNTADRWIGALPVAPPRAATPPVPRGGPLLWDNGSLVTHPGGGVGGADASLIHGNIFGYGFQIVNNNAVADDFEIESGSWQIDSIVVYGYQTGSGTTPSINDLRMQIWDGPPNDPGSQVVWGDLATNVLYSASFSGTYRVDDLPGNTNRPVMELTALVDTVLAAGQYWIEWQAGGTLGSGPFTPPIDGGPAGNAFQRVGTGWSSPLPTGGVAGNFEELPFLVFGADLGGFNCESLISVVGVWGDGSGPCGNITSDAAAPRYESALLDLPVPELVSRGAIGYSYAVDFVQNRPQERTAATSLLVHGTPLPLIGPAQIWNRMLAFNISGDGRYSIYRYNGTAKPVAVQKWAAIVGASVAPPPASNTLEVVFNGSQLTFLLNGVPLRTIPTAFAIDQFGLGFVRSRATTGNLATDDWLEIQAAGVESGGGRTLPAVSAAQEAENARANAQAAGDPLYAPATGSRR